MTTTTRCQCPPQSRPPQYQIGGWASPTRRVDKTEAVAIANASYYRKRNALREAPLDRSVRVAYCVAGQARSLVLPREQHVRPGGGSLFGRTAKVDVFAVLDAGCAPHVCLGDVNGRIAKWIEEARPVRSLVSGNATSAAAWAGKFELPPQPRRCDDTPESRAGRRMAPHHASSFWHQHDRLRQCFAMVREEEKRRGVRYDWVVRSRPDFRPHCVCPQPALLSPSRIFSIDLCSVRQKAPLLCDAFWAVPRRWASIAFSAAAGWSDCGAYRSRYPCHMPTLSPECLLTAWLVDHGIPRRAFGSGTELAELGVVRGWQQLGGHRQLITNKKLCMGGWIRTGCERAWRLQSQGKRRGAPPAFTREQTAELERMFGPPTRGKQGGAGG